jgi:hypothetical protein
LDSRSLSIETHIASCGTLPNMRRPRFDHAREKFMRSSMGITILESCAG